MAIIKKIANKVSQPRKKKQNVKEEAYEKTNDIKQLCLYFTIVNQGLSGAILDIFKRAGCSMQLVQIGEGTAAKQVLDILGITDNRKEIIISFIREELINEAKTELEAFFAASKRNKGIGFSISMSSIIGVRIYEFLSNNM